MDALSEGEHRAASGAEVRVHTVPEPAPLLMPVQSLASVPAKMVARTQPTSWRTWCARFFTFCSTFLISAYAFHEMWQAISPGEQVPNALTLIFFCIFFLTFVWIAFAATTAISGVFFVEPVRQAGTEGARCGRTALLMPVYNEDPATVAAAIEAVARDLHAAGALEGFEAFILSDTRKAAALVAETAVYGTLRERLGAIMPVWYRRRSENRAKKAGNVQDFVERFGSRYEYMVILDADSLMSGETLAELRRRMEADPELGLLQTVPRLAGRRSLFARLQQFASSVYGPVAARGVCAWSGADGNFWGHNAIIRTRAFAGSCGLPDLKGKRPFGGHIMSHDFVEAALMRRAGWKVMMATDLAGSWEESPPSLEDMAVRDRRWAQGNLQHIGVLPSAGLKPISRLHLVIGIFSYLSSPLWMLLLIVGLMLAAQAALLPHQYFSGQAQLFPNWPRFDSLKLLNLFILSMALLFLPKLIGILRVLASNRLSRLHGGRIIFFASSLVEILISALFAPITMLTQTRQVIEILRGRDSGWSAQARTEGEMPVSTAARLYFWYAVLGVAALGITAYLDPALSLWLTPALIGLVFAIPASVLTASRKVGLAFRRVRLLLIPEETSPAAVFCRRDEVLEIYERELITIEELAASPERLENHLRHLAPSGKTQRQRGTVNLEELSAAQKLHDAASVEEALSWMNEAEKLALVTHAHLLDQLHTLRGFAANRRSA